MESRLMTSFRTKLKGKMWTISRRRSPQRDTKWGEVDFERRVVYIDPSLRTKKLAEYTCHELCHVHFPSLDEDAVEQFAREFARVYHRLLAQ